MITLVIVTLLLLRGAQWNADQFPYGHSQVDVRVLPGGQGAGHRRATTRGSATSSCWPRSRWCWSSWSSSPTPSTCTSPPPRSTCYFKRLPNGLGALLPVTDRDGKPIDFMDVENLSEDTVFGRGKIEDFTWKGYLDFATCTECGRCQSQCPAWNTGKPLSPKLVIMDLRDHLFAKAPYMIGDKTSEAATGLSDTGEAGEGGQIDPHGVPESGFGRVTGSGPAQYHRPLVGNAESARRDRPRRAVVLHHLRRLRRAMPGGHRARRPHHGHAPLPGADRVVLPVRGRHHAAQPGEQGQPVGAAGPRTARSGSRGSASTSGGSRPGRPAARRHRVPVLGRLRRRAGGPGQEGHRARSPSC